MMTEKLGNLRDPDWCANTDEHDARVTILARRFPVVAGSVDVRGSGNFRIPSGSDWPWMSSRKPVSGGEPLRR